MPVANLLSKQDLGGHNQHTHDGCMLRSLTKERLILRVTFAVLLELPHKCVGKGKTLVGARNKKEGTVQPEHNTELIPRARKIEFESCT